MYARLQVKLEPQGHVGNALREHHFDLIEVSPDHRHWTSV